MAGGELPLSLPITCITAWNIPSPLPWKICLSQNRSLVAKRVGTAGLVHVYLETSVSTNRQFRAYTLKIWKQFIIISFSNNKSVYHFSNIFCACHNKSHNGLSCYFLGRWQEKVTPKGNLTDVSTSGLLSASSRPRDGQQSLFSQHKCLPQKTLMMVKE